MGTFFSKYKGTITGAKFDDVHEIEKNHAIAYFWDTYDRLKEYRATLSLTAELALCTVLTKRRVETFSIRFLKYYEPNNIFKLQLLSGHVDPKEFKEYYEKFFIISNGGFMHSILIPLLNDLGRKKITSTIKEDANKIIDWLVSIELEREQRRRGESGSEYFIHLDTLGRIGLVLVGDPHDTSSHHLRKIEKLFLQEECRICCVVSRTPPHNNICIQTLLIALESIPDIGLTEIGFEDSYLEHFGTEFFSIRARLEKYERKKWERKLKNFLKAMRNEKIVHYQKISEPKTQSMLEKVTKERKLLLYGQGTEIFYLLRDIDKIRSINKKISIDEFMINHQKMANRIEPEVYLKISVVE